MAAPARDLIFVSYNHVDKRWLERLQIFLKPLKGQIEVWADTYIQVGDQWRREIGDALQRTRVAVLLVSQEFLTSDFITEEELPPLLAAADRGHTVLVCVPVSAFTPEVAGLEKYQWARPPDKPLDQLRRPLQNAALVEIAKQIVEKAIAAGGKEAPTQQPAIDMGREAAPIAGERAAGPPGELYRVPSQHLHYLERTEELEGLERELLAGTQAAVGITGSPYKVGLHGMGGIGKSVLAIAAVNDEEVRRAFPDGVFWVTLSQQPNLAALQARLVDDLGGDPESVGDVESGKSALRKLLADKSCLLILDDLWQARHAEAFDVLGLGSRLLVTTRDARLLTALDAHQVRVDVLGEELALQLLAEWSGGKRGDLPAEADRVAASCGYLPLALSLAAAQVREGTSWADVLEALERGDLEFLDHPYGSIFKSMRLSVEALPEETAARYLELAVFPEDVYVPVATVERLWAHTGDLDPGQARRLLRRLESQALLHLSQDESGPVLSFHDLQHDFLRLSADDIRLLHAALLKSRRPETAEGAHPDDQIDWWRLAEDDYLVHHLVYHMAGAGRFDEISDLLLDLRWMEMKMAAAGIASLLDDYEQAPEDAGLKMVQRALRQAAHHVLRDPSSLMSEVYNRLLGSAIPRAQEAAEKLQESASDSWLRLEQPTFLAPESVLIGTLAGHSSVVTSVAAASDGRVVSGSYDGTVRIWDIETGTAMHSLLLEDTVYEVTVSGNRIAASGANGMVKVWSLDEGQLIRTRKHSNRVDAARFLGEQRLATGARRTLRFWDLESGRYRDRREPAEIDALGVSPDGELIAAGLHDGRIRVRFTDTGRLKTELSADGDEVCGLRFLGTDWLLSSHGSGHVYKWSLDAKEPVAQLKHSSVAEGPVLIPDSPYGASADWDGFIKIFRTDTFEEVTTFKAHADWVQELAVSDDGKYLYSASKDGTVRVWNVERALKGQHDSPLGKSNLFPLQEAVLALVDPWDERTRLVALPGSTLHPCGASLDGRRAAGFAGEDRHEVLIWDADRPREPRGLRIDTKVDKLHVSGDGRILTTYNRDEPLRIWDLDRATELRAIEPAGIHPSDLEVLAYDGSFGVIRDGDNQKVWDLSSNRPTRTLASGASLLPGESLFLWQAAITEDGQFFLGSLEDGIILVWHLDGTVVRALEGHTGMVNHLATCGGTLAASAGSDGVLIVWDLELGAIVRTFGADGELIYCALDDYGRRITAIQRDGVVHYLTLEPGRS